MRRLADYLLKAEGVEIPVSAPLMAGNRPARITLGFSAQDAGAAGRLVGHDARLVTNIHLPGREVGQLRILAVDKAMFHLLAEVSLAG